MKLVYQSKKSGNGLTSYIDADWASDINNYKSIFGYVFKLLGRAIS